MPHLLVLKPWSYPSGHTKNMARSSGCLQHILELQVIHDRFPCAVRTTGGAVLYHACSGRLFSPANCYRAINGSIYSVVGLSSLSGGHMPSLRPLYTQLTETVRRSSFFTHPRATKPYRPRRAPHLSQPPPPPSVSTDPRHPDTCCCVHDPPSLWPVTCVCVCLRFLVGIAVRFSLNNCLP